MIKNIYILLILFLVGCSNNSDPCSVLCDNCFGKEQCEECYENCYNSLEVK